MTFFGQKDNTAFVAQLEYNCNVNEKGIQNFHSQYNFGRFLFVFAWIGSSSRSFVAPLNVVRDLLTVRKLAVSLHTISIPSTFVSSVNCITFRYRKQLHVLTYQYETAIIFVLRETYQSERMETARESNFCL